MKANDTVQIWTIDLNREFSRSKIKMTKNYH